MTEERKRELLNEGLAHLGEPVTKELIDYTQSVLRGYLWRSRLNGRHVRQYKCSLCGAEFETDDRDGMDVYNEFPITPGIKHGDTLECPDCERPLTVHDAWRSIDRIETAFIEQWRKSAVDPNVLVAVGARVRARYTEAWTVPDQYIELLSFATIRYGRRGTRYVKDGLGFRTVYRLAELDSGFVGARRILDTNSVSEAVKGTPFARVWDDEFVYCNPEYGRALHSPLMHISWLGRHPAAEYLVKLGFSGLVAEKLKDRWGTFRGVNFDGKSMEEVMGLSRAAVRALRPYGKYMTSSMLRAYKRLQSLIPEWPAPQIMECVEKFQLSYGLDAIEETVSGRGYRMREEMKYMLRQQRAKEGPYGGGWRDLKDYWEECDELNVPADDYRTRHPKNLMEAHRDFSQRVTHVRNKAHDAAIARLADRYDETYGYAACGLMLRCAVSSWEVINEGSVLHHCVGRYVKQYAEEGTLIMLLRRTEEPDTPWYTVEMSTKGAVIQCRGYQNGMKEEDRQVIGEFWACWDAEMQRRRSRHAKAS